jgi:spermidine synthase
MSSRRSRRLVPPKAPSTKAEPSARARALILLLFTFSGATGLIYQVIWAREVTLVFGATSPAITTVLAAFMLGLALGSHAAGRWSMRWPRPLRVYAVIELGIGAYAIAFPLLLSLLSFVHVPLFRLLLDAPLALGVVRVVLVGVLLLPPTVLMGASLPFLARTLIVDSSTVGRDVGLLYGLNTLGAAAGVYVATFFLMPTAGLVGACLVAAAINGLVAAFAWWCDQSWRPAPVAAGDVTAAPAPTYPWVLAAYGCSGLAALGFEVVWTRILILLYGSSVYAFAVMLASFLLGLGLGSLAGARLAQRTSRPFLLGAILQVFIATAVVAGAPWFDRLPRLFLAAFRLTGGEWWSLTTLEFLMSLGIMILPTIAMGATFPLITRLLAPSADVARIVGETYAVNTWGAIVGALITGFLLVPWLGFRGSLLVLAGVNVLAACLLLARAPAGAPRLQWVVPLPAVAMLLAAIALPAWNAKLLSSGVYLYADRYAGGQFRELIDQQHLLFYREGATATVAVIEGRYRFLRINGKTDAGDSPDNLTQRLLAHIPLLVHPDPHSVLIVGLGTGVTLGAALLYPIEHADVVEIAPEVVEASRFFEAANGHALEDRRVRLRILDARTWLLAADVRYDVIISEPSNPWQTGNSTIFTLDHFRLTRRQLRPGGVFCQWLPLYRMDEADIKVAIRTFQEVFPETTVWLSGADALLVGSLDRVTLDPSTLLTRTSADSISKSFRSIGIADARVLLGRFVLDPERTRLYAGSGPPFHTDNNPVLEFSAPKTLYRESAPQILGALARLAAQSVLPLSRAAGAELARVYEAVGQQRLALKMPEAAAVALEQAALSDPFSPGLRRLQAFAWNEAGVDHLNQKDAEGARKAFERAIQLMPDMVEAYVNLGVVAVDAFGDLRRAEDAARDALRIRPGYRDALVLLARIMERQGRWDAATVVWRQLLMIDPKDPEARQGLDTAVRGGSG